MQTYRTIPIRECYEPLVPIPETVFAFTEPHPYVALGAPYGDASPWVLRQAVLTALLAANATLAAHKPGWRLKLFDAYRPVPVQAYMVWREFQRQARLAGRSLARFDCLADLAEGDPELYGLLAGTVFTFWGVPSADPHTPPPHSTGAAVDLSLQDGAGREVDMGCPIDETTERAYPDFYAGTFDPQRRAIHESRELLNQAMSAAGFCRHTHEWWHYSMGDQMAALAKDEPFAIYGRAP